MSATINETINIDNDHNTVEEKSLILFDNEDVIEGVKGCNTSLIGRLLTDKNIIVAWIQSAMHNVWRKPEGMRVVEIKPKIYQIFFDKEQDLDRVLKGSPWLFRNSWFLLKKWDRKEEQLEIGLARGDIKVQIWNLPEHSKTKKLGRKIAETLGEVKECEIYENNRDLTRLVKATVALNTNKRLLKGVNIGSKEDGLIWVDMKKATVSGNRG
ncbi:hypothetical protein PIB30_007601 [Stylosanthes scabra]|uniref:DUF4283 domain-containing protein n=1 Tax=Stylosanthes scabra TaxID=79078 RepID=A0ABU6U3Q6_9FABA|nr:hypothetical protein [Stylosanthes scabra]